jgi:hypothetical protein
MSTYIYRREDNGELIEVDWQTMMGQQGGYITLADGVQARRCVYLERSAAPLPKAERTPDHPPILSDALGVTCHQVKAFQEDAIKNGYTGIEFVQDKQEPTFYQCRISSVHEWRRYLKHRGVRDRNSRNGGGQPLAPGQLARAAARLLEQAGVSE